MGKVPLHLSMLTSFPVVVDRADLRSAQVNLKFVRRLELNAAEPAGLAARVLRAGSSGVLAAREGVGRRPLAFCGAAAALVALVLGAQRFRKVIKV